VGWTKNALSGTSQLIAFFTLLFTVVAISTTGCSLIAKLESLDAAAPPIPAAKLYPGASVPGAWTPTVNGVSSNLTKGTVTTSTQTYQKNGVGMIRFQDSWGPNEILVDLGNYDAANDFGYSGNSGNGSLTLTADTLNYPFQGGAYPVLTSFYVVDSVSNSSIEFVNLGPNCANGMWTCPSGICEPNPACPIASPSAYLNRDDWDQHQTPPYGYTSVNTFPHCDPSVGGWSTCPANMGSLPSGHYYAKYVLVSDRGIGLAGATANLRVRTTAKKDTAARNFGPSNGTINLNVILVGDKNINDSHTPKGAQNLNLLFQEANQILKAGNSNLSFGNITTYEWRDANGGDYVSQIDYSLVGLLFASGSQGVDQSSEANTINIFLVRDIEITGANYSILGISGGVEGPLFNGFPSSGLVFGTDQSGGSQGVLSEFNPSCSLSSCPRDSQDGNFLEMGATIAHELGHYLGLNHPSEKVSFITDVQRHDPLSDTPTCAPRAGPYLDQLACYQDSTAQLASAQKCSTACDAASGGAYYIGTSKTVNYCPNTPECEFNHLMWYTTKQRSKGNGVWMEDGNQISPQSSAVIQWNPFVR